MFGNSNIVACIYIYINNTYIIWGIYIYVYIYIPHILLLHILYILVWTLNYIICIFICNTIPYSHIPHDMSPLCTYTGTFWKVITVLSIVMLSHVYCPHDVLLIILYINTQTLNCVNCISKYNIVPSFYCPHVISLIILYIDIQTELY